MSPHPSPGTLRSLFFFLPLALSAAACSQPPPSLTVQGHTLTIAETDYGQTSGSGLYCNPLDSRGQYEVIITDFTLCSTLKPMSDNRVIFHSTEESNLRIIFSSQPDVLKKVPPVTKFMVGPTDHCKGNPTSASAAAFFAHNPAGSVNYDIDVEAEAGSSVSVTYFTPPAEANGTYDLIFGGTHVTGSFVATYCKNLAPGLGL